MAYTAARPLLFLASAVILASFLATAAHASGLFSTLPKTLVVTASPTPGQVVKGGEDKIKITWGLNKSLPAGTDDKYKTVKVKLCYAPVSQKDRPWRKTVDHLNKDKTCQFKIVARPYAGNDSIDWTVEKDAPTGTYFVRVYAFDAMDGELGYGETTDAKKTTNLFQVEAISGRHATLDIVSICFSVFSVVSLFGFFFNEKRKGKAESK
ncbi:unnamed protein product [Linum trigynum]|uniref:High-affinity nitrate transporter n=1 Tax=Linum trigynum TaxID=586398 RepID=A0AAV2EXV4_9ROSI